MSSGELYSNIANTLLPDDLWKSISPNLVPSGYDAGSTDISFVPGYDHLVARLPKKDREPLNTLRQTALAYNDLQSYGIDVLPYDLKEYDGKAYILTLKVTGKTLDEVLAGGADEVIIARVDDLWAKLIAYRVDCHDQGKPCAEDIYTADQYMIGTINGDSEERLWLVDLGQWTIEPSKPGSEDIYTEDIEDLAYNVLDIEERVGRPMQNSRRILEEVAKTVPPGRANIIREALESGLRQLRMAGRD